jgi:hypothetical protein
MSEAPSEKTQAKAAEYLLSGRVKVQRCIPEFVEGPDGAPLPMFFAHVFSAAEDGDPYHVKFTTSGWHCDCPARVQLCAHVLACQAIFDFEKIEKPAEAGPNVDIDALLNGL